MLRTHGFAMFYHHGMLVVVIAIPSNNGKVKKNSSVCERWVAHGCPAERYIDLPMFLHWSTLLWCVLLLFKIEGYTWLHCIMWQSGEILFWSLNPVSDSSWPLAAPWNCGSSLQIEFSSGFLRRAWLVVHFSEIDMDSDSFSDRFDSDTARSALCLS